MPSEAEWEYAARAGSTTARFWGNGLEGSCLYANGADRTLMRWTAQEFNASRFADCDDGFPFTGPAGPLQPNSFGLRDMLGNVWERCADHWHDSYSGCPTDGSAWTVGGDKARRVLRGGSWNSEPWHVRAGYRSLDIVGVRRSDVGFRLARTFV